ncbi:MAG: cobyric acid synthase [Leptospirales bacterium]|nr:cobyric acid synthase [Leptospirales bacterium]
MQQASVASSVFFHGGDLTRLARQFGLKPSDILDFSSNINPLGPPDYLRAWISQDVDTLDTYPEPRAESLCNALAASMNLPTDTIVVGNGANELIYAIVRAAPAKRMVTVEPTFVEYRRAAMAANLTHLPVLTKPGREFPFQELESALQERDIVFLAHPNNPTGALLDRENIAEIIRKRTEILFVIDESFIDFVDKAAPQSNLSFAHLGLNNVIVLRSFTKFFAIPGLRLGYSISCPDLALRIQEQLPAWNVNAIAQSVGKKILSMEESASIFKAPGPDQLSYAGETRALIATNRSLLLRELAEIPQVHPFESSANFILCELKNGTANDLSNRLMERYAISIRSCHNYLGTTAGHFRVAVRSIEDNTELVRSLRAVLAEASDATTRQANPVAPPPARNYSRKRNKRPAIMLQGTGSNAGKTLMTAAFCRILLRQGLRVAPFKSQNMSLNSFVTARGEEISRAQALQAVACKIEPDTRMNPVLLKPNADTGSHVLLHGKPVGHMRAVEYQKHKASLFKEVKASYDSLCEDFDAIVLEGAGSPGEVNLKKNDIVNMNMARYAESPVLIVGDIDRGGVFASFVGTMEVLTREERAMVRGFLINKFRGDPSLLRDALDYTLLHTGKPVLGIVPYLRGLNLPEEDSVTFKSQAQDQRSNRDIQIAIVDLPHISNFTDFDALRLEPDVQVQIVRTGEFPGTPDVIIIPGTRNTIYDLSYLNQTGLAAWIETQARRGAEIVGLCGGFQMLGQTISDAGQIESNVALANGLRLLDVETAFASEKTLKQSTVVHIPSGISVRGYEVHHGQTKLGNARVLLNSGNASLGCESVDGMIWGTYLHGIFDDDQFRRWFIDRARTRQGLQPLREIQARYDMDAGLDRLADEVQSAVKLEEILRIMGL